MAGFAPGSGARAGQGAGVTCSAPEWGADYTTELARARAIYESVVKNPGAEKMFTMNPAITAEDEQAFLERNLELLSSMSGTAMSGAGSPLGSAAYAENVSSRLATSSMSSTDMLEDVSAKLARLAKLKEQSQVASMVREKSKGSGDITLPAGLVQGANGANGAPGTSQNEVLANFFQSLLTKKAGAGGAAVPGTNTSVASLGSGRSSSVSNAGGSGQRSTSMTLGGGGSSMGLGASSATSSPQGSPQSVNGHLAVPGSPPDRGA
ncbi:hypothetical protein HK101_004878 [Irineochytrium annulatum]|nr:hypothetical protein HK101_004878 [Irineochytrium annulatum]